LDWSQSGQAWLKQKPINQPSYWTDKEWNQPDHPVVGVSYYEAEAFSKWKEKRLPTELEWERAARGTEGREYPWGDEFDSERCNTRESGIGRTTSVTKYPNGVSPEGCYDMAGNVWEWTSSWYDKDKDSYVLRGGSWNYDRGNCRCAVRLNFHPSSRNNLVGFRCART
jgi:iron(II)-dependent oxidoreductase